jgi:hypothetical protein
MADSVLSISPPVNGLLSLRDRYSGWDLLSRWNHTISAQSETSLQVYFDRSTRGDTTYGFGLNTFDIDFQHHIGWGRRQDLVRGLGYRLSSDDTLATLRISFTPASSTLQCWVRGAEHVVTPDSAAQVREAVPFARGSSTWRINQMGSFACSFVAADRVRLGKRPSTASRRVP